MDFSKLKVLLVLCILISFTVCQNTTEVIDNQPNPEDVLHINNNLGDSPKLPKSFFDSFLSGFGLIFVSEVGDKTFFLTILYAMEHTLAETVLITSAAMCSLNFVSLSVGFLIPFFLYRNIIDWVGIVIFTIFGIMMLHEAYSQEKDESLVHELEDLQKELEEEKEKEDIENKKVDKENDLREPLNSNKKRVKIFTSRWAYVSGLIVAEMGDKSQISAIVLGAINNYYGVLLGTTLAFILCIILSAITGKELSAKFTHKQLTILGGCMFLLFALVYFVQVTGLL